ncbi:MAG: DNA polymerase III subunit delta [Gammaproteobacteria bacterium]|nr:DNA polymerase III subunit delta [Gammaproteobacteria bacterium]
MRLSPDTLPRHLTGTLAPAYLVCGDEHLLVMEALDAIRAAARGAGILEREVLEVDKGFDWQRLVDAAAALSLFGDRRLIELRLAEAGPGAAGGKALQAFVDLAPPDILLLVTGPKLDRRSEDSAWFKAVEAYGAYVAVPNVGPERFPAWLESRLAAVGLGAEAEALELLAERSAGNCLAAAQEIAKLALLHPGERLSTAQVAEAVADSARYDVYQFIDTVLAGDQVKTLRMLSVLEAEGVEPAVMIWALSRECRTLAQLAEAQRQGGNPSQLFREFKIWSSRENIVRTALRRYPVSAWQRLDARCLHLDKLMKGQASGMLWDEIRAQALLMAGAKLRLPTEAGR